MIRVEHLVKSYGAQRVVDDLSFAIKAGEIVGFLGPNGAGKTTTMRMITGYLYPDSGSIEINGQSVAADSLKVRREIGYLPESNPLYRDMLVADFLRLSAELKGIPAKELKKSFEFVVQATGLGQMFYRPIGELSKGYKQRVGLAAALLHQPAVLILDEPTEGLDPLQRQEIRSLIKDLSKKHTIIMSTHVMQEVSAVCNRVLIINKGKLVADGTPSSLQSGGKSRVITVELEGEGVPAALKTLKHLEDLQTEKLTTKRYRALISVPRDREIERELSALVRERELVVWQMTPQETALEDIFHSLTDTQHENSR